MRVYVRLPSLEEFVVGAKFDSMQAVAEWVISSLHMHCLLSVSLHYLPTRLCAISTENKQKLKPRSGLVTLYDF